eukprot:CAMPEP_0197031528 /NCGR_PEP_ID=MMETSP1384-20130603/10510_1 /TAXON_ID=29189 /ORGANISM="Ammonia sp." /LENGTH=368 /DNA_ID=CAMNT_0042461069 /DNA_START=41 /DNA_END=1147 /DNA_ORIENTATION=-
MGGCYCLKNADQQMLNDQHGMQANNDITGHMKNEAEIDGETRKLLLLGAGSSGKSTLLKQLRFLYLYQRGYPDDELQKYTNIIHENLVLIMTTLCRECVRFGYEYVDKNKQIMQRLLSAADAKSVASSFGNTELKQCLQDIWSDPGIQKTYLRRSEFILMDNSQYLLNNMDRIISDEYAPTFEDCVYCRSVTTGITTETFIYETSKGQKERYMIVDVGGQRTERKKWIKCFDDVMAILFCIALSGYDQMLWEDNTANRFEEALKLLHEMVTEDKYKPLRSAKYIVFLNKRDLLKQKIAQVPFRYKNEFQSSDYDETLKWIQEKITSFDLNRTFYFNITCATDTEDVERVFQICRDIIIRNAIGKGGFF